MALPASCFGSHAARFPCSSPASCIFFSPPFCPRLTSDKWVPQSVGDPVAWLRMLRSWGILHFGFGRPRALAKLGLNLGLLHFHVSWWEGNDLGSRDGGLNFRWWNFEAMGSHCLLVFTVSSSSQGFLGGAKWISSIVVYMVSRTLQHAFRAYSGPRIKGILTGGLQVCSQLVSHIMGGIIRRDPAYISSVPRPQ